MLTDTKLKVELFKDDLKEVLSAYRNGNVVFLTNDHKKAVENRLGIYFFSDDDNDIFRKVERVISYLENKVDYFIFGHYHVPVDMSLPSGARLLVLKDWMDASPYICFDGTDVHASSF